MIRLKNFIFCVVIFLSASYVGLACTCGLAGVGSEQKIHADQATFIFSGKVVELNERVVKIQINKFYKGDRQESITLLRSTCFCTCDIDFRLNESYLVYANFSNTGDKKTLITDVCTGTKRFEDSQKDIDYLENPPKEELPDLRLNLKTKKGTNGKGKQHKKSSRS